MVEREELPVFELRRSRIDRRDRHPLDLNREPRHSWLSFWDRAPSLNQ